MRYYVLGTQILKGKARMSQPVADEYVGLDEYIRLSRCEDLCGCLRTSFKILHTSALTAELRTVNSRRQ